jgi:hypothetical protein
VVDQNRVTPYPFTYPPSQHVRRHGPTGYNDYGSYRDWLRDEFSFRCVFCLRREQWGLVRGVWDIDHFIPQSREPESALTYDNLLYVCRTCNISKSAHLVPDPCAVAYGQSVQVKEDGTITALNDDGQLLIDVLHLDNDDYTQYRLLMLRIIRTLAAHDWETLVMLMGYPNSVPDLSQLRPPGNTRPEGVDDTFFVRRTRGELEEVYE